MILSYKEKYEQKQRQRQLELYEEEMVKRYQANQNQRNNELAAIREAADQQREQIF